MSTSAEPGGRTGGEPSPRRWAKTLLMLSAQVPPFFEAWSWDRCGSTLGPVTIMQQAPKSLLRQGGS